MELGYFERFLFNAGYSNRLDLAIQLLKSCEQDTCCAVTAHQR